VDRKQEGGKRRKKKGEGGRKRKEEKEKRKEKKKKKRGRKKRERAALGGIRGDGRPCAAVTAVLIEYARRSGDTQRNARDEEKKEK
jgi:hypothetical protein